MFRFLSNLWHSVYNYVSVLYPDTWVNEKGRRQLVSLDYNQFAMADNLPIAKKYYKSDGQIHILTWNIHHGLDWLMRPTIEDMAQYLQIAHAQADVICLQEVDTAYIFIPGVGLVNQAIYLTTQLGYYCY